jgi:hypothetical protein
MGVMAKKNRVSVHFYHKLVLFSKTVGVNLRILDENFKILKTCQNSYTGSLYITDSEYGGQSQEILSFDQFFLQSGHFL